MDLQTFRRKALEHLDERKTEDNQVGNLLDLCNKSSWIQIKQIAQLCPDKAISKSFFYHKLINIIFLRSRKDSHTLMPPTS